MNQFANQKKTKYFHKNSTDVIINGHCVSYHISVKKIKVYLLNQ